MSHSYLPVANKHAGAVHMHSRKFKIVLEARTPSEAQPGHRPYLSIAFKRHT